MAEYQSDEELEGLYRENMRVVAMEVELIGIYSRMLEATGTYEYNGVEWRQKERAMSAVLFTFDFINQLGIARCCVVRLGQLRRELKRLEKKRPNYIDFDETTQKHIWNRSKLFNA